MPDPVTAGLLATTALNLVAPYLIEAAKGGAAEIGKELVKATGGAAATLWHSLRDRLAARGAEKALARFEANPTDPKRQNALELELEEALEAEPTWRHEVAQLVHELGGEAAMAQQQMRVSGTDAIGSQVAGSHNTISIRARGQST